MVFCFTFESLPGSVLEAFFGESLYSNLGLNVLPPLFQGMPVSSGFRSKYIKACTISSDDNIASFPTFRIKQKSIQRNRRYQITKLLKADYRQAIAELAEQNGLDPQGQVAASLRGAKAEATLFPLSHFIFPEPTVSYTKEEEDSKFSKAEKLLNRPVQKPIGNTEATIAIVYSPEAAVLTARMSLSLERGHEYTTSLGMTVVKAPLERNSKIS
uniref:Uncharacterized protein n=1 Tax=Bionectria ochroleuca TaxID=29856 RepID=A0A8H7TUC3_BIOOC